MAKRRRQKPSVHKKSLEQQIEDPAAFGVRAQERSRNKKRNRAEEDENELVSAGISARILKEARAQQQEVDAEEYEEQQQQEGTIPRGMLAAALQNLQDSDEEGEEEGDAPWSDTESLYDANDVEVSPDDEKALAAFMAPNADAYQQRSLADLIAEKMQEQQQLAGQAAADEGVAGLGAGALDERVVEVYRGVGKLLSRYTVGKVPKAFKIIPNLRNWEEVLALTEPHHWTPHAVYQATRIFVSNMNSRLSQRFLALVLLPRVRDEIRTHQRLHFVLFQAMRKSTYKPAAFFKGLLLPLAASRTCTLREAVIFTSCLKRSSLPVLHSAAALLRLAELEYCGTTSFFMRVLLDKKYALPIRVLAALTRHFLRFQDDGRQMPVVWHQTLLCFVQRYKNELTAADRDALRTLCTHQKHYQVTPEVLRELDHGVPRDQRGAGGVEAMQVQHAAAAGVAIGKHVAEDVTQLPPVMIMED